jgi:hypothetical protein
MPVAQIKTVERSSPSLVIRIGSHPIVYSVTTILAIGAVVFFFAVAPMVRMLQPGGTASLVDAQVRNKAASDSLDSQKALLAAVDAISAEDRDLLAYALPQVPDAPGLAIQLNSIALRSGVRMSGVDVAAATSPSSGEGAAQPELVKPLSVAYTVDKITYDTLKILLSTLESSLRIFDVMSLSFSPNSSSVSLELRTYYLAGS